MEHVAHGTESICKCCCRCLDFFRESILNRNIDVPSQRWPRSRGVGEEGYDNTDLHHLRPADCNVNSARSNRLFGSCGIGSPLSMCTIPANSEAANDTERDSVSFLPPENSRGDIARAILYMDLRYDGDDGGGEASRNVIDLMATDCPDSHQMGYLSQLLEWHAADPPDEREEKRNNEVCECECHFCCSIYFDRFYQVWLHLGNFLYLVTLS